MLKALIRLRKTLPFPLLGIHSDNGAEFINETILAFTDRNKIQFREKDRKKERQSSYSTVELKRYQP